MKRFRSNTLARVLCFVAVALFVLPMNAVSVFAKEGPRATTKVKHKPIEYFVPEKRIKLETEVTDEAGVNLVRCYFRAVEQADYVFVAMTPGSSLYKGVLPAPSKKTEMLEYLFLVVNGKNQVVKTQTFKVEKKDEDKTPAWQEVSSKGDIHVSTELAQAPTAPPGFTDSIAVDVVESSARFGLVVAGIYTATQAAEAGGTTGTAAAADSAGTISAKTGGISKLAYVGGAALIAGGAAALGGGGGGGGGGKGGGLSDVTVSKKSIDVSFWDCGDPPCDEDGDVIDIVLNGTTIYYDHWMSRDGVIKHMDLNSGKNTLKIVAKEDGDCPGNTACLYISDVTAGNPEQQWNLSATGAEGKPQSASMSISVQSGTTSTTTSPTTTTTSTTTAQTTTTSTTTAQTTTTYQTTSTTTADPCAGNHAPQVLGVSLYGYPSTSHLCQGDYFAFTASCYDAEGTYDIDKIRVKIVNTYTGAQNTQDFTPQPSGYSTSFSVSRVTGYIAGWAQVQYCLYVQLRDKCGYWSNERGICRYSSDCYGQQDDDYDDYYY